MPKIDQYSRFRMHRTTISGQLFTVPLSNDHSDETWLSTDLYIGELGINVTDDTIFMRTNNGIVQLASNGATGSGNADVFIFSTPNIVIGSTYSADSLSPRSGYYTDLGTSTLRWKDMYLGGAANGRTTINVNGGMLLTEIGSNGILSTGYDSNDNTPFQLYGTSSSVNKSRAVHINSYNAQIGTGNQKVSIASKNVIDNASSDSLVSGQSVTINTGVTSSVHLGFGYNKTNYDSMMVTAGNLAVRGIADDGSGQYTKSDWVTKQAKVRTNNALTTTIVSIPWTSTASGGDVIQIKAYIIGVDMSYPQYVYSSEIMGVYSINSDGSLTVNEIGTPVQDAVSSFTSCDSEMAADGNNVYIKVKGEGTTYIQWLCTYSYHRLINITV